MIKFIRKLIGLCSFLAVLFIAVVLINGKTLFFKEIGTYIPFLAERCPALVQYISGLSDTLNNEVIQIPVVGEWIVNVDHIELPVDPDDIAANVYSMSDTMLTFNNRQNISVSVSGGTLDVYGVMADEQYLVYQFLSDDGTVLDQIPAQCNGDGEFRSGLDIPDGTRQFTMFTGSSAAGEYSSIVYNYIFLKRIQDGSWIVEKSPVYADNVASYEKERSLSRAIRTTAEINSDDPNIVSLAESVTADCATDYEKAMALHDWVCDNIYYDTDNVGSDSHIPYTASEVLNTRKAVCAGYANLYAALCRAVSLPCNAVNGYAAEMTDSSFTWEDSSVDYDTPNHAWNEVHIDNRWLIVDTTWDSRCKIKNGVREKEGNTSYLYFDANLRFFSQTHKILKYVS